MKTPIKIDGEQIMDIGVSRDWTPMSWWIRWWTSSPWSHTFLLGENGTIYTTTIKGYSKIVGKEKIAYLEKRIWARYRFPGLTDTQKAAGIYFNDHNLLRGQYAYTDVVQLFFQNMQGKGVGKLNTNSDNYFCSEAVSATFRQMGVVLAPQKTKDPSAYTPSDVVDDSRLICQETNSKDVQLGAFPQ